MAVAELEEVYIPHALPVSLRSSRAWETPCASLFVACHPKPAGAGWRRRREPNISLKRLFNLLIIRAARVYPSSYPRAASHCSPINSPGPLSTPHDSAGFLRAGPSRHLAGPDHQDPGRARSVAAVPPLWPRCALPLVFSPPWPCTPCGFRSCWKFSSSGFMVISALHSLVP